MKNIYVSADIEIIEFTDDSIDTITASKQKDEIDVIGKEYFSPENP